MNLAAVLSAIMPLQARADTRGEASMDPVTIGASIDMCLRTALWPVSCIGRATQKCRAQDVGAANPVQQPGWCSGAEQFVWESRMEADIAEITRLLPGGPALRDFQDQQAQWEAYARNWFPYDRATAAFPYGFWGDASRLPVVAVRAIQVHDILGIIADCRDENGLFLEPLCTEARASP